MGTKELISKVKRHHHVRAHSKGKRGDHESIEWELDEPELNPALWKLQSPKFENQDVPTD